MDYNIDFSLIDLIELRRLNISTSEVRSVFSNDNSFYKDFGDFVFLLGFSDKRKFIKIAYGVSKNLNFEIEVFQNDLPYEEDIKTFWCPIEIRKN